MFKNALILSLILIFSPFSLFAAELGAKPKSHHFYELKLGGGYAQTGKTGAAIPYVSIGDRFDIGDAAIELAMGWGEHKDDEHSITYFSLPKITYLQFYSPTHRNSLYYGGGVSWSSIKNNKQRHWYNYNEPQDYFRGIFAEGVLGYELNHDQAIRTMLELNVSQPVLAHKKEGKHPGPTALLLLNFGF